jgi:hypothetical protein
VLCTLVKLGERLQLLAKYPNTEVPGSILELVRGMLPCGDGEDLIQLFQGKGWKEVKLV